MTQKERDALLTRLDQHRAMQDERYKAQQKQSADHETRVRALEKRWYTAVSAAVLSVVAFIKSLFA